MVSPEYRKKVLKPLNDRFCLAEACLLADVVQHLQTEAGNKAFHPRYRTYQVPVFYTRYTRCTTCTIWYTACCIPGIAYNTK